MLKKMDYLGKYFLTLLLVISFCSALFAHQHKSSAGEVSVFSGRKEALIKPLLDKFSESSGIKVNLITAKSASLLKRLELEGPNTTADVLITSDVGRLHIGVEKDLFGKIDNNIVSLVPKGYADKDLYWVGLSKRIRSIVYSKEKVDPKELSNIEDLSSPKWKGKICVRSSNNIYNQSLVASYIYLYGEKRALEIVQGLVNNFAKKPSGNDRAQIKSIAKGECTIAIVNHYYYARMLLSKDKDQKEAAEKTDIFFLNQNSQGSHTNISGIGLSKFSKNRDNAQKLISFLLNNDSQLWYAKVNNEYPVMNDIKTTNLLEGWGDIKLDYKSIPYLGRLNAQAVKLMDKVGWR